ncbi:response regulator transcription factor [Metabacillus fastidiosus]|uniref:response regulator transcription factor n=1 Tax=Metabacillus fastidiosus TaxID=1458 RepID=UPI002DBFF5A5|nr:response regulator transcription factor [Metabacillus fastidiosus]MEC2078612.1 response regulator transcription factor [Metabacillus fastidiosus]
MTEILIVDDHQIVGEGTKNIIEQEADFKVTYLIDTEEALLLSKASPFDVYLLDMNMPNCSGLELSQLILAFQPEAKIILYTGFEYSSQFNLLIDSGISGIISKSASQQELIMAIKAVLNNYTLIPISLLRQLRLSEMTVQTNNPNLFSKKQLNISISQKELEILEGISKGKSNKDIAEELFMSVRAVEYNLTKLFKKLKVNSRSEALAEAVRKGIINVNI